MTAKPVDGQQAPGNPTAPADADKKLLPERETGVPGCGQGRVDVTGIVPEDIHVDPYITEGQPGYQESGSSEVIPNDRLNGGGATGE
jgi:hypothetical protein